MGTEIKLITVSHLQTHGQSERTIRTLEDSLMSYTLSRVIDWEQHLPLVEFTYNNTYQASLGVAPFEVWYGRPCRTPTY